MSNLETTISNYEAKLKKLMDRQAVIKEATIKRLKERIKAKEKIVDEKRAEINKLSIVINELERGEK